MNFLRVTTITIGIKRKHNGMNIDFKKIKRAHAIGIGGIGVSALAKYLALHGAEVSGSDSFDSEIVREAAAAGVKIFLGHKPENISKDIDFVFYSDAVPEDNAERAAARELGIAEISYAKLLGELSKTKQTIAISGTNGKSTTTAMVGLILERAGYDPTVIVGSKVPGFKYGNLRIGSSDWLVVEADEYRAHLLDLFPAHAIITNIEEDHLDYYRDLGHIKETFREFAKKLDIEGNLVINNDDPASAEIEGKRTAGAGFDAQKVSFGIKSPADYVAKNISVSAGEQSFEVWRNFNGEENLGRIVLRVPGRFNLMNALGATALCLSLGISFETIQEVLSDFQGIWRRFERVGTLPGSWMDGNAPIIISDYAHHPTAVSGTISAAREFYPGKRIVAVFQPHQHNRTKKLFDGFVHSFAGADMLILPEIYDVPGREESEDQDVSSKDLVAAVKEKGLVPDARYGGSLEETESLVRAVARAGDVILIMGAGTIDKVARQLCK